MIANFHINYGTKWGEQIAIQLKRKNKTETIVCQTYDGKNWQAAIELTENEAITYKYILQNKETSNPEFGEDRSLTAPKGTSQLFVQDFWRPTSGVDNSFFSAAFKDVIFKRDKGAKKASRTRKPTKNKVLFQLNAAAISQDLAFCVLGNTDTLGNWEKPVILSDKNYPVWQAEIDVENAGVNVEYKYAIYDPARKEVVEWESGPNRNLLFSFPSENGNALVQTDENYRYPSGLWQGAGVAVPVFSLRSKNGLGIGEYTDIKLLVDWAVKTNMKLVQVLPVNDTIVTKTWKDSYPYRAISVFALHPMFINVNAIATLKDKKAATRLKRKTTELNKLEAIDFEKVFEAKMEFFRLLFNQEKNNFIKNKDAKSFIEKNKNWLKPYAAFCHLRDINGTAVFQDWKKYSVYSGQVIKDLCSPKSKAYDEILFYYFLQFHAHQQLFGATEYARQNGVVLKGDLPIGIARESSDAWVAPHLYNMNGQAGAPPDFYSENGQNWGFPTYNWEEMSKDGFEWWRQRMTKLAEYFDALRIDHILGFFRIWEIPTDQVIGTMGVFNPRLPYSREELRTFGLFGGLSRYTQPYIRGHFLRDLFGSDADYVRKTFLHELEFSIFALKEFVDTQRKIKDLFANDDNYADKKHLEAGLMKLVSEVLLLEEPGSHGTAFNPRITLSTTRSFKELTPNEQAIFENLYNEYHFNRHNEFWRQQAEWKLPALLQATNMFICGEDLGMIPASVPGVMQKLNILTLEIQRMAKGDTEFGEPESYPYTSVCSPSCHDMATVRGWWEEDYERSTKFFHLHLDPNNPAPQACTPSVVETINWQHLESPSMWAIFPIQDLVGMNADLRRADANAEQINDPSNPEHYWRFRFHLNLEDLLKEEELNGKVGSMVVKTGR